MNQPTVLLLFGGESSEHDVSISSARNVYAAIDETKYAIELCYIDRSGKWWLLESFEEQIDTHGASQLLPAMGGRSFVTLPDTRLVTPNVILPILHGKNGEDGSVQGVAQLVHLPIVGCDLTASAVGMDKILSKQVLGAHSITTVPYEVYHRGNDLPDFSQLVMRLGSPMFVKPARSGSSVGVSKIYTEEELAAAIELAVQHCDSVLIEHGVTARELEVAVLGTPPAHQVSHVGEVVPGADYYSYDDKYDPASLSTVKIPAEIDMAMGHRVQALASRIYEILGCSGLSRIDFFLSDDNTLYFNEINTLPGFTNVSMYPKLWKFDDIGYSELIGKLIDDALNRATIDSKQPQEVS